MSTSTTEQAWLAGLVGDWTYIFEAGASSDHPGTTATGRERVWAIGEVWVALENVSAEAEGTSSHSLTTIGFQPDTGRFMGQVIGTMSAVPFLYDGVLDAPGSELHLVTEGPAITPGNDRDRYRDVFRMTGANDRVTIAQVLTATGEWREFMRTTYRRV
jgi:hypothetical protein